MILCLLGSVPEDCPGFSRQTTDIQPRHIAAPLLLHGIASRGKHFLKKKKKDGEASTSPYHHHTQPSPSPVCLLRSLHNAGINFPKPISAAARFAQRAQLLCREKEFPLHTSLEVDHSSPFMAPTLIFKRRQGSGRIEAGREVGTPLSSSSQRGDR